MKKDLGALNDYLFEQLERLNDDEELADDESFKKQIQRRKAITQVSTAIVNNAKLVLDAKKYAKEYGIENEKKVLQLGNSKDD